MILVQQKGAAHHEAPERRVLQNGSSHEIYKVYFTPDSLLAELGGGELLYRGSLLLVARRASKEPNSAPSARASSTRLPREA